MRKNLCFSMAALLALAILFFPRQARAESGAFADTRFQGQYTTENLDAILEEYELNDGWYWTTLPDIPQTFHGQEEKKGWTQTSKDRFTPKDAFIYSWGWFGCRWNSETVDSRAPNRDGWGECFGFAQFLGYLLSGQPNPHGNWPVFSSYSEAGGFKPGDIVRIEYTDESGFHQHSAMVYSVDSEKGKVLFLQASGSNYNRLYIRQGYTGAGLAGTRDIPDIIRCPGLKILRAEDNLEGRYPRGWTPRDQ